MQSTCVPYINLFKLPLISLPSDTVDIYFDEDDSSDEDNTPTGVIIIGIADPKRNRYLHI